MLRITRKEKGQVIFKVSGQLNAGNLQEMKTVLAAAPKTTRIVFNLRDLTSVDSEAVELLEKCEATVGKKPCL